MTSFAEITPNLPFTEFDFDELYRRTFIKSELGRMKSLLPLWEMAENLGLTSKSMMPKRGRKSYFTPEGKVALMFFEDEHAVERTEADGVGHDQQLAVVGEVPDTIVSVVSGYTIVKLTSWNEGHELGKYRASVVHRGGDFGLYRKTIDSNRAHQETLNK